MDEATLSSAPKMEEPPIFDIRPVSKNEEMFPSSICGSNLSSPKPEHPKSATSISIKTT